MALKPLTGGSTCLTGSTMGGGLPCHQGEVATLQHPGAEFLPTLRMWEPLWEGGLPGGRKGVRAAGSVQAFFKITTHHWYCSQNGSLSFLLFQSFFGSTTTSSSNRLLVLAFATCGTSSHLSLTAVRNINQLPKTFFLVNKSLLERWCQNIYRLGIARYILFLFLLLKRQLNCKYTFLSYIWQFIDSKLRALLVFPFIPAPLCLT